jgi:hypothetical protein
MAISKSRWAGADPIDRAIEQPLRGKLSLECTEDYLDRVFNIGIMNAKSRGDYPPGEIFESWPSLFKDIFTGHLEGQGGQAGAERYAEFGYDLPDALVASLKRKSNRASAFESLAQGEEENSNDRFLREEAVAEDARFGYDLPSELVANELVANSKSQRNRAPVAEALTQGEEENSNDRFLRAIIAMERTAHSDKLRELSDVQHAEREAFVARIYELQSTLDAERGAFVARIDELQTTLDAEREAFIARINELQTTLAPEPRALALKNILTRLSSRFRKLLVARTVASPGDCPSDFDRPTLQ